MCSAQRYLVRYTSNRSPTHKLLVGVANRSFFLSLCTISLTRTHNYWARQGVPGPRPLPLFGTYFWQFFVPMQELEEERYAKYGKIYGYAELSDRTLESVEPNCTRAFLSVAPL